MALHSLASKTDLELGSYMQNHHDPCILTLQDKLYFKKKQLSGLNMITTYCKYIVTHLYYEVLLVKYSEIRKITRWENNITWYMKSVFHEQ